MHVSSRARRFLPEWRTLVLGLAMVTVGVTGAAPAQADDGFLADAENGLVTPPWSSAVGGSSTAQAARGLGRGFEINSTSRAGYLRWVPRNGGGSHYSVRTWVQVKSRGAGQSIDLITVRNTTGVRNFDFFVTGDTFRFKWDLYRGDYGQSNFRVELDRWYLVEIYGDFAGTHYTANVRIDGQDQRPISTGSQPARVQYVVLGTSNAKTHRQFYDNVLARVQNDPVGWLTPAVRPAANG